MFKATVDFELDGKTVKAGDELEAGTFAADDLAALLHSGAVVDLAPKSKPEKKSTPVKVTGKEK